MSDPLGVLFASWMGLNPSFLGDQVRATYTVTGASIAPTDRMCVVSAASGITLTLPSGTRDGQPLIIKNIGAGALTLSASIDGTAGNTTVASLGALRLLWSATLSTWLSV